MSGNWHSLMDTSPPPLVPEPYGQPLTAYGSLPISLSLSYCDKAGKAMSLLMASQFQEIKSAFARMVSAVLQLID